VIGDDKTAMSVSSPQMPLACESTTGNRKTKKAHAIGNNAVTALAN
jgi:hypothetical protein